MTRILPILALAACAGPLIDEPLEPSPTDDPTDPTDPGACDHTLSIGEMTLEHRGFEYGVYRTAVELRDGVLTYGSGIYNPIHRTVDLDAGTVVEFADQETYVLGTTGDRALQVASSLIRLLKSAEYVDPSGKATGTSYWDRTMIVFATEFGRDKWNTGSGFGTGHNMNNGILAVSPMLDGGKALGEADPNNGHICGYDLDTGAPEHFRGISPGEDPLYDDPHLPPGEEIIYGGLLDVLGVSYEGQQVLPALRKG